MSVGSPVVRMLARRMLTMPAAMSRAVYLLYWKLSVGFLAYYCEVTSLLYLPSFAIIPTFEEVLEQRKDALVFVANYLTGKSENKAMLVTRRKLAAYQLVERSQVISCADDLALKTK